MVGEFNKFIFSCIENVPVACSRALSVKFMLDLGVNIITAHTRRETVRSSGINVITSSLVLLSVSQKTNARVAYVQTCCVGVDLSFTVIKWTITYQTRKKSSSYPFYRKITRVRALSRFSKFSAPPIAFLAF